MKATYEDLANQIDVAFYAKPNLQDWSDQLRSICKEAEWTIDELQEEAIKRMNAKEKKMTEIMALGDAIYALTPMQAGQLVDYLYQVHGIKAAGSIIQQPPDQEPPKEEKPLEQTEFTVLLMGFDASKKIGIVKEARTITGLGLKESMVLLNTLPATIKEGISKAEAEKVKKVLEDAGAKVIIK